MSAEVCALALVAFALGWLVLDVLGIVGHMPYSPPVEKIHPQEVK